MEKNIIYQGDNIESLRLLPDNSVDMCVTSPPYYNLRDYGTATWVGGDPNCDHKIPNAEHDPKRAGGDSGSSHVARFIRDTCYKCGAKRVDLQIGLEQTPEEYIQKLVAVFHEVKRVLKDDGTLWVNIGDSYNGQKKGNTETNKNKNVVTDTFTKQLWQGAKQKDLIGIPWMLAFALRADGWYLRQDIIWNKPNAMPEPAKDRCNKSHEYIFLLSKKPKYYFDYEAIQEKAITQVSSSNIRFGGSKYGDSDDPHHATKSGKQWQPQTRKRVTNDDVTKYDGSTNPMYKRHIDFKTVRNKRDVWDINTSSCKEAHFAVFPTQLVKPCILAGCKEGGVVLDPFMGSGTTAVVARKLDRNYIGCELNPEYVEIAKQRLNNELGFFQ